jgi:hypothetical protein
MRMNGNSRAFLLVFLLLIIADTASAENEQNQGYICIQSVNITLQPGYADVSVTYSLDGAFRFLILMFGENDVKTRLLEMLAFENATIVRMDYESADLKLYDIKPVYGDGLYWFPAHQFGTVIPNLSIHSNQSSRQYENVNRLEDGIVYY